MIIRRITDKQLRFVLIVIESQYLRNLNFPFSLFLVVFYTYQARMTFFETSRMTYCKNIVKRHNVNKFKLLLNHDVSRVN